MKKNLIETLLNIIDQLDHELENNVSKDLFKLHKDNRDRVLNTISDLIIQCNIADNKIDINAKEKLLIKKRLSNLITDVAGSEYVTEQALIKDLLESQASKRYYINTYFHSEVLKINYNLKKLPDKKIKKIIDEKIEGKSWSNRLWKSKRILEKQLRKELYDLASGKTDINKISEIIQHRYKQNSSRSRTLVRTEATKVQAESNEEWAKTHKIIKQMFMATFDNRTSSICRGYDGEVFGIDDKNKPIPPLHPNCRSVLVNMPYDEWKPSVRIDNITKKNVNYSTYEEWKSNQ